MKMDSDKKYINDLIRHTKESIDFFSNEMKPDRERSVCAAFLRCLGFNFYPKDILPNKDDPPDVIFESAQFEVIELYDKRRKRLDECENRLEELKKAKSIDDTLVTFHLRKPISYQELFSEINLALNKKALKYGKELCSSLDALVYVGLPRFLNTKSAIPNYKKLINQGWRSVSFVIPPYSHVIFCKNSNAPKFLLDSARETKSEWKEPDEFFDL